MDSTSLISRAPASRLRICCSGFVDRDAGSVASAGFVLLEELLRRGHQVDYFSKKSFVYPEQLLHFDNLSYHDVGDGPQEALHTRLPSSCGKAVRELVRRSVHLAYARRVVTAMQKRHRSAPHDVTLFLGTWAYGRLPGTPVVSWIQGPPGTDSRSIRRHGRQIRALCGTREYAALRLYASWRESVDRPPYHHTDVVICGSEWSKERLARAGGPHRRVYALPYPIDLERFRLPSIPRAGASGARPRLLWIGRIIPRKRLDLFLDSARLLIERGIDVDLQIVGDFPFASGYRRLLDGFPLQSHLQYWPRMARDRIAGLYQEADILVQPSEEENFGSGPAEALACGTPAVVGPTNGTAEYLAPAAGTFSQYQPSSVADSIQDLLARLVAQNGLRSEARARAETEFDVRRIVNRLEAILYASVELRTKATQGAGATTEPAARVSSGIGPRTPRLESDQRA